MARALAGAPSVHEPAAGGECLSCHDLSLPGVPALLRGAATPGGAVGAPLEPCEGCHDPGLSKPGGAATGFRDGPTNLHFLHVAAGGGRGRRCLGCHAPHTAPQTHLLRAEIPARSGPPIPLRFRARDPGGRCETGCHAPKDYPGR